MVTMVKVDLEKFKGYRQSNTSSSGTLLAGPVETKPINLTTRNRNPIIKDMESELLSMGPSVKDLPDSMKKKALLMYEQGLH